MKQPVFEGACTAIITPFRDEGIDFETLDRQLDFQINAGIAAIVCAGTTGENATLEIHEHNRLVDFCVRKLKGKTKIIVGVGGNNTAHCLSKARDAALAGADAVLMTPPYYNKTSQKGLIKHFLTVADASDIPMILYNVPSRTSIGIAADAYKELAKHDNINGTKEASGDIGLITRIACECGDELNIWSGNDDNTVAMMAVGAKGVISVLSNVVPEAVARLCQLCLSGRFDDGFDLYRKYSALCRALFWDVNPIPVKAAMKILGRDSGRLRLPLAQLEQDKCSALSDTMAAVGLV